MKVLSHVTYFASNFFIRSAHNTLGELNSKHAWQFLTTSILWSYATVSFSIKPEACTIISIGQVLDIICHLSSDSLPPPKKNLAKNLRYCSRVYRLIVFLRRRVLMITMNVRSINKQLWYSRSFRNSWRVRPTCWHSPRALVATSVHDTKATRWTLTRGSPDFFELKTCLTLALLVYNLHLNVITAEKNIL